MYCVDVLKSSFIVVVTLFLVGTIFLQLDASFPSLNLNNDTKTKELAENVLLTPNNPCISHSVNVPRNLWMLWDKGWENAPPLQKMCLERFKQLNPDWNIRALSLTEAKSLIDLDKYYSSLKFNAAIVQHKADIIRIELLAKYGGVWADATIYSMEPLSNWIDTVVGDVNLFMYERKDRFKYLKRKPTIQPWFEPWVANWFIAATNDSRMLLMLRDKYIQEWRRGNPGKTIGYFCHHIYFHELAVNNTEFRANYNYMTFLDAGGPQCWPDTLPLQLRNVTPHVYKISAPGCSRLRNKLVTEFENRQQTGNEV